MAVQESERTFLFADLSGFTALTEAHGNFDAANVAARYRNITEAVLFPRTRLVKTIGDEVMIVGDEIMPTVQTATALFSAVNAEEHFPAIRIGLHVGKVVEQGGDFFGMAANLAARVASKAGAGQILCTEQVMLQATTLENATFWSAGTAHLKNIAEPVPLYQIVVGEALSGATRIDPVCRMCLQEHDAQVQLKFGNHVYYFCSFQCARAFIDHPEYYIL